LDTHRVKPHQKKLALRREHSLYFAQDLMRIFRGVEAVQRNDHVYTLAFKRQLFRCANDQPSGRELEAMINFRALGKRFELEIGHLT